jgi:BASS family bile acid:Na+ symporter
MPHLLIAATQPPIDASQAYLAIAIGFIMLGLGLTLTVDDIKRVTVYPKAVIVGLVCQTVLLPLVCVGVAVAFGLPPELAVGLMLLAASPGGATANLYSHLAHGDVALNITLTSVNSFLSLFTLPFIVNYSIGYFYPGGGQIGMQFDKVIEVFAVVLFPVSLGMFLRAYKPDIALKAEKPVKIISAILLFVIIIGAILKNQSILAQYIGQVGLAALAFNLLSMGIGYGVPLMLNLPKRQAVAIGMEIGIHNATLAILIAQKLNNPTFQIPPAIYGIIMFVTAAVFGWLVNLGRKPEAAHD